VPPAERIAVSTNDGHALSEAAYVSPAGLCHRPCPAACCRSGPELAASVVRCRRQANGEAGAGRWTKGADGGSWDQPTRQA